jgi:pimeloyl-ACP methyl ester carboxylesterase
MRRGVVPLSLIVILAVTVCTASQGRMNDERSSRPIYRAVECPSEVALVVLVDVECGSLMVPAHRGRADVDDLRLFVARLRPDSSDPGRDPVLLLGGDLGTAPDYVTLGGQVEGLDREVVVLDARGTGRSEPSLACPEIEQVRRLFEVPVDHPRTRREFLAAIHACRDRLVSRGVDVSAFDLREMAADAEDLRIALAIDRWNVLALGTTSRIALEYVRTFPRHVRSIVLDSPAWPGVDPFVEGVEATRHAVSAMAKVCSEDSGCRRYTRDFAADVRSVASMLESNPVVVDNGDEGRVLFDPGWFLVWLRTRLTFIRPPGTYVPHAVAEFARGSTDVFRQQVTRLRTGNQRYELCQLFLPNCWPELSQSFGVYLSVMCRDVVPFIDPGSVTAHLRGDPGYEDVFGRPPLLAACAAWDAGRGDPETATAVRSAVPTLVILGEFSAFGQPSSAREAIAAMTNGYLVVSSTNGHQVTGTRQELPNLCMVQVRDAWLDDPTGHPETPCTDDVPFDYSLSLDWEID